MFNMELIDWIRTLALIVSVLILVAFDRKTWMIGDAIIVTGVSICLVLYPVPVVGAEVEGELDDIHIQISRLYGALLICGPVFFYLTKDTRDGTVPITIMSSRIFTCGVIAVAQIYTYYLKPKTQKGCNWNDQFGNFGMVATFSWLVGNLIHLMKSHDFSTYPQYNVRINTHLRIDAFICGLGSLFFFSFPDAAIHSLIESGKLDKVHLHLARNVGVQGLASALISLQAVGFLHEHDKRHQFVARILTTLGICTLLAYFDLQGGTFSAEKWTKMALIFGAPVINAVLGYFSEGTMFYRTSSKKE